MTLLGTLFGFEGRINRSTFWLCAIAVALLEAAALLAAQDWGLLPLLVAIAVSVWAGLALAVKRLHDRGRSGLFVLAGLIPIAGWLWLAWELALAPGRKGGARFDPDGRPQQQDETQPGGWLPPAAAASGGAALFGAARARLEAADIAPVTSYGVLPPAPENSPPEGAEDAPAQAEAVADEPTPQETRAQIAAYLASVDHPIPPESERQPAMQAAGAAEPVLVEPLPEPEATAVAEEDRAPAPEAPPAPAPGVAHHETAPGA